MLTKSVLLTLILLQCSTFNSYGSKDSLLFTRNGTIKFESKAELETIHAFSSELKGVVTLTDYQFAFSVEISSFHGFKSETQFDHFTENYLEINKYPKAFFKGRIIDTKIFESKETTSTIRIKGDLWIHGIKKEIVVSGVIKKKGNDYSFDTIFQIQLSDFQIKIPRIVSDKISNTITISVSLSLS